MTEDEQRAFAEALKARVKLEVRHARIAQWIVLLLFTAWTTLWVALGMTWHAASYLVALHGSWALYNAITLLMSPVEVKIPVKEIMPGPDEEE